MGKSIEELEKEYNSSCYLYKKLCQEFVKQLSLLLEEKEVILASQLEFRVKTFDSISEKMKRNSLEVNTVSEINDLAGIRIVTLFKRDLDKVTRIIAENFIVNKKEDTSKRLSENQFGYGSIHFEVSAKEEWLSVPTLKPLKGLSVEIQLRTASQHIWAASSHILQYKHEADVHPTLIRAINRSAALLEVVDLEFERVLTERENYLSNIEKEDTTELLNVDLLRYTLDKLLPPENKIKNESYSTLLEDLIKFDIKTPNELKKLIIDNYEQVMSREKEHRGNRNKYFNHVGLVRVAMRIKYGDEFIKYSMTTHNTRKLSNANKSSSEVAATK